MPYSLPLLVVDDTELCRISTALLLETLGFKCQLSSSAFDALDRLKVRKYGAVIMDYDMPGMTGAECTATIRKLEETTGARIPVIGLTSHTSYSVKKICLDSGMDAVLPKDCQGSDLFDILEPLICARSLAG